MTKFLLKFVKHEALVTNGCYYLIKVSSLEQLVAEDGWLTIHLLDRHLGVTHHHIPRTQQSPDNLGLGIPAEKHMNQIHQLTQCQYLHNISKLDLLLAELFLVLLQPSLVVLDEQVNGVT